MISLKDCGTINAATKAVKLFENQERSIVALNNEFILLTSKRNSIVEELQEIHEIYSSLELYQVLNKFCLDGESNTLKNCYDIMNGEPVYELYGTGTSIHCNITFINRRQNAWTLHFNIHKDNSVYINGTHEYDRLLTIKDIFSIIFNRVEYQDLIVDLSPI